METGSLGAFEIIEQELARGENLSIIALVNAVLLEAHQLHASDIHIDPSERAVRVRLRVDGVLHEAYEFSKEIHEEVIARIKVLAGLRTDEHAASQDGRFRYELPHTKSQVDLRVSIVPTYHGENAVLRLLTQQAEPKTLNDLGFSKGDQAKIRAALKRQNGMILATGPTGSGKTTTLYTMLTMLNRPEVSIVTIEDPIEYAVDNIEQIPVNARAGLTFANGLRSILRQDPDIIMVGEIRDKETASIAVNTALTGHLLLSSVHTSNAATTLPRLLDMGIDPYLVASTVTAAIGQRLVRSICISCIKSYQDGENIFYKGEGCNDCSGSGYSGRLSINEVLVANDEVCAAILRRASAQELQTLAVKAGMTTMLEDGMAKVRQGKTTLEEVLRVTHE
jgi:type II secretory ATPase GspE/PulE/Tfp pilus assembly ATPase PilB-like protein